MRYVLVGYRRYPLLLLPLLLLALTLAPLAPLRAAEPAPPNPSADSALVARVSNPPAFGMTVIQFNETSVPRAKQAGATSALVGLYWFDIEPIRTNPPTYNWSIADERIKLAIDNGIEPFMLFTGNPSWSFSGQYKILSEEGRRGLAQMAAAAAQRYKTIYPGKIRFWSFYNEPDCSGATYSPPGLDSPSSCYGNFGAEYTKMLQEVYPAVKAADPNALVTVGGLAFDRWESDFAESFLNDMLTTGGGNYFDVMNFHYYVELADKWNPYGKDVVGKTNYIRSVMAQHGVYKPIILTEIGKSATLSSNASQADYLIQGLTRAYGAGNSLVLWYQFADDGYDWEYGFGIIDKNGAPKPSYTAFKLLSEKLAGLTNSACPTTNYAGVEAYVFKGATRTVIVAWSADSNTQTMKVPTDQLVRTDRNGSAGTIRDGDDGATDSRVSVLVGPSPIFLEINVATPAASAFRAFLPTLNRAQSTDGTTC